MSTTTKTPTGVDVSVDAESDQPEGWVRARLGDIVVDAQPGFACGVNNRERQGIGHLRPMNVNTDGQIALTDLKYVPESRCGREERLVRKGDVLFNNTNSTELVGKTAYYGYSEPRAFSNHMTRLRCWPEIFDPRFGALALHQRWREGFFKSVCNQHVSQSSVSRTVLLETEVALPPLPEQQRIVAKIEELFKQVNASRDRLARVPKILNRFRQSVLAAACSGRLTEDWRAKHPDVEPARILIQKIEQYRIQRGTFLPKTDEVELDLSELREPPDSWTWTTIGKVISDTPQNGLYRPRTDYGSGTPIVRIDDFQDDFVRPRSDLLKLRIPHEEARKFAIHPGDVLINRVNSPSHIGKCLLVQSELCPAVFESNMMKIHALAEVDPRWVVAYLRCGDGRKRLTASAKWAVNQVSINQTDVCSTPISLPPLDEQHEIVRWVEALFKLADMIEKRVEAATKRANKLTQAILAKAFRGELVPTEAELARREGRDYEPASVRLERIRAEREKSATTKSDAKRPRRSKPRDE